MFRPGIIYIALPLPDLDNASPPDPQRLLKPYLDATLALSPPASDADAPLTPLFSTFYIQHPNAPSLPADGAAAVPHLAPAPLPPILPLPDAADAAAVHAESVFWEALKILRPSALQKDADDEEAITSLWPPMENKDEDEDD